MSVEIHEEAMTASPNYNSSSSVSNDQCSPGIAKGKRTKRQRQLRHSPAPAAPSSPTYSSSSGEYHSGSATEEEEDMANCLILLAQGHALQDAHPKPQPAEKEAAVGGGSGERFTSRRLAEAATMANGKASFYVYECKTCSKCFPSFQALGGHRASHKKPKMAPVAAVMAMEENKPAREDIVLPLRSIAPCSNYPGVHPNYAGGKAAAPASMINSSSVSTGAIGNTKPRVHECSICGSEFSSGQALGGHMRRHRTAAAAAVPDPLPEARKEKNILCLDLNLPAPIEDEPPFRSFPAKQPLIFSASPLVDCHY